MPRIEKKCPGDCANCQLARNGEVDMIPCILDQIFTNQRRLESKLDSILTNLTDRELNLASNDEGEN